MNWQNATLTLNDFVQLVQKGQAFSAHFQYGYRKSANFICADMIAADINSSWTIEQIFAEPFVKEKAAFLYTTASHTAEQQHIRVVFLLEQTIIKAKEWAHALAGLGRKLNADPSIKDAGRLFYGNSAGTFYVLNNTLPASDLHDLIEIGSHAHSFNLEQTLAAAAVSYRSSKRVGIDDMVQTAAGEPQSLRSLPRLASVRCPYHLDRNHSAFVVHSTNGTHGIHCMACGATFWTDSPTVRF